MEVTKLPGYQVQLRKKYVQSTLSIVVTSRLLSFIGKMYGSYQVTRLPDITEEVICTIHILVLLLQISYQMVTKLYRENVWKLPSYQVTRYN